jgi:DNA-binding MarR family transcriptional regulator
MSRAREASTTAALVALRRIVRQLRLADREIEEACGLSVAQLFVLHQLAAAAPLSIAEVAARTLTDPSSVSTVIARLVGAGLVVRKPSPTDRRRALHSLTARGRRVVETAPQVPQAAMIDAIRGMSTKRRAEVVRSLELLSAALGAPDIEPRLLFEDEPVARVRARRKR